MQIKLHPVTPHQKRIFEIADQMRTGGVVLFPTDSQYALGCDYKSKKGIERIRRIKGIDESHLLTLLCDSLSGISQFAKIEDYAFKIIKRLIPGPYTFVLPATKDVPRLLLNPKRQTVGFRVPDYPIVQKMVEELGNPIIATTAKSYDAIPGVAYFREDLIAEFEKQVDVVVDNQQDLSRDESTVLDFTGPEVIVIRKGTGYDHVAEVFATYDVPFQENA